MKFGLLNHPFEQATLSTSIQVRLGVLPAQIAWIKELFPFFKGLLPEGWYLNIVSVTQKVDSKDSFGVLIGTAGTDTIGAVTVRKEKI